MTQRNIVALSDCLQYLVGLDDNSIDMIYIDPPFNTGKLQVMKRLRDYGNEIISQISYSDIHTTYLDFLLKVLVQCRRVLTEHGSLYLHLDYRECHRAKVLLDDIFGPECFLNEIIWAYDYGARQKNKWPTKHDNILVYVKHPKKYYFSQEEIDRIPYMSPELVGWRKALEGKIPTDVWWHTIVPTNSKERTGYPNQKPVPIVLRCIVASCIPSGRVLDVFCGSGTTGIAADSTKRYFTLVDNNPKAIQITCDRLRSKGIAFDDGTVA